MVHSTPTRILFRTDASIDIGTGHVMRCLTLANALHEQGGECTFVCRAHAGHLGDRIKAAGHALHLLPNVAEKDRPGAATNLYANWLGCSQELDAEQTACVLGGKFDWLVVDHYGLDRHWESEFRKHAEHILTIDDLADRAHDCDVLLDQNLGRAAEDYDGLVPDTATRLIGPRYILLRPEFAALRERSKAAEKVRPQRNLLIAMGGVDLKSSIPRILEVLAGTEMGIALSVQIPITSKTLHLVELQKLAATGPVCCEILVDADAATMAHAMFKANFAISAMGFTSYELACMGVPTLLMPLTYIQYKVARELCRVSCASVVEGWNDMPDKEISHHLTAFIDRIRNGLGSTHCETKLTIDGFGCNRVITTMTQLCT